MLVPFDRHSPDDLPYEEALVFCRALGGKMAMPGSIEEEKGKWQQMFGQDFQYHPDTRFFYLPISDNGQVVQEYLYRLIDLLCFNFCPFLV